MEKRRVLFVTALALLTGLSSGGLASQALAQPAIQARDTEMKHYKSDEWNFEIDIPKSWNRFPPVSSNSPYEVTRFALEDEKGRSNLIVFRMPYDQKTSLQTVREGTIESLTKGGFSNFVRAEAQIGSKVVPTLEFDKILNDKPWYCRYFYFTDGTLRYILAFGTTNREATFPLDDRIAKTFVTTN